MMSCSMKLKLELFFKFSKLLISPVDKSSKQITFSPLLINSETKFDPIKPAPPVTRLINYKFISKLYSISTLEFNRDKCYKKYI